MTNEEFAKKIIETVGGEKNILSATNCMTRLRLHLAERDEKIFDAVKKIEGVLGTNLDGDEFQIILGPGKATNIANAVNELLQKSKIKIGDGKELHEQIRARNATPIKLFFKKIASIFMPLIPGFNRTCRRCAENFA